MLEKISIKAVIKNSVKLCTIGSKTFCPPLVVGKTTNHNNNIFDLPNEYIISLKNGQVSSVSKHDPDHSPAAIGN